MQLYKFDLSRIKNADTGDLPHLKELMEYYSELEIGDLKLLKAQYESIEEDNKQTIFLTILIGLVITVFNLALSSFPKNASLTSIIVMIVFVVLVVTGISFIWLRTSMRNINTSRNRKVIDLVIEIKNNQR